MSNRFEENSTPLPEESSEAWKHIALGDTVCVHNHDGLYRVMSIDVNKGSAYVRQLDEHGEETKQDFIAKLDKLSKDFA